MGCVGVLALCLRLIPPLLSGTIPFFDPWMALSFIQHGYYWEYLPFYPLFILFVHLVTGLDSVTLIRFLPPIINSLSIVPMYFFVKSLTGDKRIGIYASILWGVSEIGATRQSSAVAEGFGLLLMPVVFYLAFSALKCSDFKKRLFCLGIVYVFLGGSHHLNASMTLLPMLAVLLYVLLRCRSEPWFRRYLVIVLVMSVIWLGWAQTPWYRGFIERSFDRYYRIVEMIVRGQLQLSEKSLVQLYITVPTGSGGGVGWIEFFALLGSSLITGALALVRFCKTVRNPMREREMVFLTVWAWTMGVHFLLNVYIDMVLPLWYAILSYRAWVYFVFPLQVMAASTLTSVRKDKYVLLLLIPLFLTATIGATRFIEHITANFPPGGL